MTTIAERYRRLLARRAPADDRSYRSFTESFEVAPGDSTRYLVGAMRALDAQYTARLTEQGTRVQDQLRSRSTDLYPDLDFERQGSVSNGTHIKFYSDVDVLVLIDKYVVLERPQVAPFPYKGVPEDDLIALRRHCLESLRSAFPKVDFDDTGSKAITMSGGSLACRVDVVPANWYDTVAYASSGQRYDRAVQVLDRDKRTRIKNQPFLFNHRIDSIDHVRRGVPRMLIRLLKTVKSDLEEETRSDLSISSFDLCSIVYRMPNEYFAAEVRRALESVRYLSLWMKHVIESDTTRNSLMVVDDTRMIFDSGSKLDAFHQVFNELCSIYAAAVREHGSSASLLTEAHYR
jgi:hypothetical protein